MKGISNGDPHPPDGIDRSTRSRQNGSNDRSQFGDRPAAVAQGVLHDRGQFPERPVVLGDLEEGVVPESAVTAWFRNDPAPAFTFHHGYNRPRWVGEGGGTDVVRRPVIAGLAGERGEQLGVVPRVVSLPAGPPGGVDARLS